MLAQDVLTRGRLRTTAGRRLVAVAGLSAGLLLLVGTNPAAAEGGEAPSNVVAWPNAPGWITLNWTHSGEGVYGFVIEQEAPFATTIADINKRNWTVTGLEPSHTYRYRVCAVFDVNRVCSDWVSVTTLPAPVPPPPPPPPPLPPFPAPVLQASYYAWNIAALTWGQPPYAWRVQHGWLYRDGQVIFDAVKPPHDIYSNFVDPHRLTAGYTHRYKFCWTGDFGERCSNEVRMKGKLIFPFSPSPDTKSIKVLPRSPGSPDAKSIA